MSWDEYEVTIKSRTTRILLVKAQSPRHAMELAESNPEADYFLIDITEDDYEADYARKVIKP